MTWRQTLGFAAFCLLGASRWLLESAYPERLHTLAAQSVHYGAVAVAAIVFCCALRSASHLPDARLALASLFLLGVPALVSALIPTGTALFALVPLCIAVGLSSLAGEDRERAVMLPALAGLIGALLVLPLQLPAGLKSGLLFLAMCGAVAASAIGSVWMHRLLREQSLAPGIAVFASINAVWLAAMGGWTGLRNAEHSAIAAEAACGLLFDLPQIALLLWLLRELQPARFAARFFIVPLLTILEGLVIVRGPVDARLLSGLALLLGGAGALLRSRPEADSLTSLGL